MRSAPDSTPTCAPDSFRPPAIAFDSGGVLRIGIGAATDFFCAAKAAEGASPRTVEWYRMILIRAVRRFGDQRPVDAITAAEHAYLNLALKIGSQEERDTWVAAASAASTE